MVLDEAIVHNGIRYEWLGQSSMRLTAGNAVIYIDPVMLDDSPPPAGLILITHHHVDHCLPEFITPIRNENTRVAAFHESYIKYCVHDIKGARTIKVGQTVDFGIARVTGVEAYTKRGFHMKGEGCGFLIEVAGQRVYFAGDTSFIPEMNWLGKVDAAIMPIADNTWNISLSDIAEALKVIKPCLFIPVHYTPVDEPDPAVKDGLMLSKDPRFFTKKEDPGKMPGLLEGTGIRTAILKKLVAPGPDP